jgi:pilus assembly protein CpaE
LRNVVRLNTSLNEQAAIKDKVKIIVNRVGLESGQITLKKAQETLGKEIFAQLPNDYRTMSEVRNNGVPLVEQAPRAAITQSVLQLAATLCDDPDIAAGADKGGKGKWFGLWSAKAKT